MGSIEKNKQKSHPRPTTYEIKSVSTVLGWLEVEHVDDGNVAITVVSKGGVWKPQTRSKPVLVPISSLLLALHRSESE